MAVVSVSYETTVVSVSYEMKPTTLAACIPRGRSSSRLPEPHLQGAIQTQAPKLSSTF